MKVFVCVKQVPDTEAKINISADKNNIETAGIKWVLNPYDEFAVEEAIKFKEKNAGAQVWAITVGPKARAVEVLRTALAMGADEAIVINSNDNLDSFSTAKLLADAIKAEGGAHLVFSGKLAIDDNQSSVPQMVAEFLNIPHTTVVSKFEAQGENVVVEREIEGGAKEVVQMMTPALIAANKGLNMPRYASLPGIMKAKKKVIKEIEAAGNDSKVKFSGFSFPADKAPVKMLSGDAAAQSQELIRLLREESKVL